MCTVSRPPRARHVASRHGLSVNKRSREGVAACLQTAPHHRSSRNGAVSRLTDERAADAAVRPDGHHGARALPCARRGDGCDRGTNQASIPQAGAALSPGEQRRNRQKNTSTVYSRAFLKACPHRAALALCHPRAGQESRRRRALPGDRIGLRDAVQPAQAAAVRSAR